MKKVFECCFIVVFYERKTVFINSLLNSFESSHILVYSLDLAAQISYFITAIIVKAHSSRTLRNKKCSYLYKRLSKFITLTIFANVWRMLMFTYWYMKVVGMHYFLSMSIFNLVECFVVEVYLRVNESSSWMNTSRHNTKA